MNAILIICLTLMSSSLMLAQITPFQPNVDVGGSAVAIAVKPDNAQIMLAASEMGGLFRTIDGGEHWQHVDGLKRHNVTDVAFAPDRSNIVIATVKASYLKEAKPIWRSSDAGISWSCQFRSSWLAPLDPYYNFQGRARIDGYCVAFQEGSNNVYVGTDNGLFTSPDLGEGWSYPQYISENHPEVGFLPGTFLSSSKVFSILAHKSGYVILSCENGVWYQVTHSSRWEKVDNLPLGQWYNNHAFAALPFDSISDLFYAGSDDALYVTNDGVNWRKDRNTPEPDNYAVETFVRIAHSSGSNGYTIYYGNGTELFEKNVTSFGPELPEPIWSKIEIGNYFPTDIAIGRYLDDRNVNAEIPILIASSGGVHKIRNTDRQWYLTGGGVGGFNALGINELLGQQVSNPQHTDLYFATERNHIFVSDDFGNNWVQKNEWADSWSIQTTPQTNDERDTRITFSTNNEPYRIITRSHLTIPEDWKNPVGEFSWTNSDPALIKQGHYLECVGEVGESRYKIYLTTNFGNNWSHLFDIDGNLHSSAVSVPSTDPYVYWPIMRESNASNGVRRMGLIKIKDIYSGDGPHKYFEDSDGDNFGSVSLSIGPKPVIGVNPNNPDHIIIADIEDNKMKYSYDGGETWQVDHELTREVTDYHHYEIIPPPPNNILGVPRSIERRIRDQFEFHLIDQWGYELSLVSCIAFDPYLECHILVGTRDNGIFRSVDGGGSWSQIPGSMEITEVSSFYFSPNLQDAVIVSSFGRGLWKLNLQRSGVECGIASAPGANPYEDILRRITEKPMIWNCHDWGYCSLTIPSDSFINADYVIVNNGYITDLKMDKYKIRHINISGGVIFKLNSKKEEIPLGIPYTVSPKIGNYSGDIPIKNLNVEKTAFRGLVIEKNVLKGLILSEPDIRYKSKNVPVIYAFSVSDPNAVRLNEKATIAGKKFSSTGLSKNPVKIKIDNVVITDKVLPDEHGKFKIEIDVKKPIGVYTVRAEQKVGKQLLQATTVLSVVPPTMTGKKMK